MSRLAPPVKLIQRKPLKHDTITPRWHWRRRPVTICLAAIGRGKDQTGANYDVVVTASDRMITLGGRTEYTWSDQTNAFWFSNRILSLTAGDPEIVLEIYRIASISLENKALSVRKVADKIAQKFREFRATRAERRFLSPQGLTFMTFAQTERTMDQSVVRLLRDRLDEAELNAEVIVAGLDESGAHIYLISDPGEAITCDSAGFAAIGLGREHAESVFAESQYTQWFPWTETVMLSYLAKKRAEAAPGVGISTDLYWIRPEGWGYVAPEDELNVALANVRRDRDRRMKRAVDRGHLKLRARIESLALSND